MHAAPRRLMGWGGAIDAYSGELRILVLAPFFLPDA